MKTEVSLGFHNSSFEFPKIRHGLPSIPVSLVLIGFHGLPRWRNPWKLKLQSTDVLKRSCWFKYQLFAKLRPIWSDCEVHLSGDLGRELVDACYWFSGLTQRQVDWALPNSQRSDLYAWREHPSLIAFLSLTTLWIIHLDRNKTELK